MAAGNGSHDNNGASPLCVSTCISVVVSAVLAAHLTYEAGQTLDLPPLQADRAAAQTQMRLNRFVDTLIAEGSIASVESCGHFYLCVAVESQFHALRQEDRRRIGALLYQYAVRQRVIHAGQPFAVAFIDKKTGERVGRYTPENGRWLAD